MCFVVDSMAKKNAIETKRESSKSNMPKNQWMHFCGKVEPWGLVLYIMMSTHFGFVCSWGLSYKEYYWYFSNNLSNQNMFQNKVSGRQIGWNISMHNKE